VPAQKPGSGICAVATVNVFGVRGLNEPDAPLTAFAQPTAPSVSAPAIAASARGLSEREAGMRAL